MNSETLKSTAVSRLGLTGASLPRASDLVPEDDLDDDERKEMVAEEQGMRSSKFSVKIFGKSEGSGFPELKAAHNSAVVRAHGSMTVRELKAALAPISNLKPEEMLLVNPRYLAHGHAQPQPLEPDYRTLASCGIPGSHQNYWDDRTLTLDVSPKKALSGKMTALKSLHNIEELSSTALAAVRKLSPAAGTALSNSVKTAKQLRAAGMVDKAQGVEIQAVTMADTVLQHTDVDWAKVHNEYRNQVQASALQGEMEYLQKVRRGAKGASIEDLMSAAGGQSRRSVQHLHKSLGHIVQKYGVENIGVVLKEGSMEAPN